MMVATLSHSQKRRYRSRRLSWQGEAAWPVRPYYWYVMMSQQHSLSLDNVCDILPHNLPVFVAGIFLPCESDYYDYNNHFDFQNLYKKVAILENTVQIEEYISSCTTEFSGVIALTVGVSLLCVMELQNHRKREKARSVNVYVCTCVCA